MKITKRVSIGAGAVAAILALAPFASGHATVSLIQPQGKALTGARASYVLRVPNEKSSQATYDIVMTVPPAVSTAISVRQMPDWNVVLYKHDTGQKTAEGAPIYAIDKVRWIAKPGNEIQPGFYGVFEFRLVNPTSPQKLCFPTIQWYTKKDENGKAEAVRWTGDSTSPTPASCLDVVTS